MKNPTSEDYSKLMDACLHMVLAFNAMHNAEISICITPSSTWIKDGPFTIPTEEIKCD